MDCTVHGVAKRYFNMGIPGDAGGKESTCNAGDPSSIPGSGKPTG